MSTSQQIIQTLRSYAHRTDVERSEEAAQALQQFGDEAVLALADAMSDPDEYVRVMALEVLYYWSGDTTVVLPAMIRALDDSDRIVRICAASTVSQHVEKASEAAPTLLKWLDTDDDHSRLTAAALILKIDPAKQDEMLVVLRGGMDSGDSGIRCLTTWLLSGLQDVTPDARRLLKQMLNDEDEFVRSVAAEELGSWA